MSLKSALLDGALIVFGAVFSILFAAASSNGQNVVPIAMGILLVVCVTCLVSFAVAWLVRFIPIAVVASIVITDLPFVLYMVFRVAYGERVNNSHAAEEAFLLPIVFIIVTAPAVLSSAMVFGRIANRIYQKRPTP